MKQIDLELEENEFPSFSEMRIYAEGKTEEQNHSAEIIDLCLDDETIQELNFD